MDGAFTFEHPERQIAKKKTYAQTCIQTLSPIPEHADQYYFECEVKCNGYIAAGLGFTEWDVEIVDDRMFHKSILGIQVNGCKEYGNDIYKAQYGFITKVKDVKLIHDENTFGLLLKKVWLGEHQVCFFQSFINGIKIGHPMISDKMELYPSIWFKCHPFGKGDRNATVKCNLGEKSFKFDPQKGKVSYKK